MTYRDEVLADSPFAYWRLEETASPLADSSVNSYEGTNDGATLGVDGQVDRAASFTAAETDRVDFNGLPIAEQWSGGSITVEGWIKTTTTSTGAIYFEGSVDSNDFFVSLFINGNGNIGYIQRSGASFNTVSGSIVANDGEWHHCIARMNDSTGDDVDIYVDAQFDVNGSTDNIYEPAHDIASLGVRDGSDLRWWLEGTIDEIALYNGALSATRIQAHYDAATTVSATVRQVTETTIAQGVEPDIGIEVVIGQASETTTARGVLVRETAIGQAVENTTTNTVSPQRTRLVGQATQTNTVGAVTHARADTVGQASETTTTGSIGSAKTLAIGQATETSATAAISPEITTQVGQATEASSAGAITHAKAVSTRQVTESDLAQGVNVGGAITVSVGQTSETDLAQGVSVTRIHSINPTSEMNTASGVGILKTLTVGQASELATAEAIDTLKSLATGQATETDTAGVLSLIITADQVGAVAEIFASVLDAIGGGQPIDLASDIVVTSSILATMGIDLQLTDVSDTVVEQVKRQSFVMGDPG